jgi:hypothetical protein
VQIDANISKGVLTFLVNGHLLPHKVEGINGDITAAVFIAGDEGDAVEIYRMTGTGVHVIVLTSYVCYFHMCACLVLDNLAIGHALLLLRMVPL